MLAGGREEELDVAGGEEEKEEQEEQEEQEQETEFVRPLTPSMARFWPCLASAAGHGQSMSPDQGGQVARSHPQPALKTSGRLMCYPHSLDPRGPPVM